ncbi:potassium voltage-gated channel protein eag-like isoform X2 [Patiria miniata]|uniref:Potassium voltage-gated channel protein eag n=1 Tax=Patiria miniata TaxID=46514 RepID=A0A914BD79_PATMI|nr:potassium voltage-gated channel protein eag-like isoform X2 [Patiria miniata]
MTGRTRADVMQKSSTCNFMYGDLTDKDTIKKVEKAFEEQTPVQVELVIYKRNRTPMWSLLQIAPIKNEKDQIVLFLCTFKDITSLKQPIEDETAKGLSRFARLARTVTRSKSVLVQVAQHLPNMKSEQSTQNQISQIAHMLILDAEVLPQYKREAPKTPPHIILHYCTFKTMWDWIILLLTFYTAVAVPFNVAFDTQTAKDYISMVVDGIVDIVFFIDVILNFHTTFVGPGGEVVSDPKVIRMNYLKSWFIIDLLSCLPYDVINAFQQQNNLSTIFSALKVVRLLRLGRVVRKLDHYIEYGVAFLILLMLSYMLFAHWAACIWYSIGLSDADANNTNGWLAKLSKDVDIAYSYSAQGVFDPNSGPDVTMKYISSLYYTMSSFTSVGFGNIAANTVLEKVFTILMMVVGSLLYATIFGNVTTIFQQFTHNTARYHDMLNNVKEFMKLHQVDKGLSERVMDYVVSSWSISKGIDSEKVLSYCPKDMKADVCVHLNRSVFSEHAGFRLASEGCLRALAINFTMSHSAPGDLLIHVGESVDSLWFVVSGSLEVIQDDEVVAILGAGDVFGDCFWKDITLGQAAANVKALTYCDLHSIRRDDLMDVLNFYQAFANSFARNMVLTYNLRHRLVFRKVADVKREQAEAEKRKNEPPIPADHPVRKMLNKFRKLSDVPEKRTSAPGKDVEKGENDIGSLSVLARMKGPMLRRVPENNDSPGTGRNAKPGPPKEKLQKETAAPVQNAKPASKWGAFKKPNQLRKTESTDSGILRSESKLDEIGRHDSKEGTSSMSTSSTDQQLLTSLMEIKLELKEEIEHLSVKMNRLDEQIGDIIKFFSPESSPYSSNVPSSNSSRVSSMNEVAIASPQKSPITVKVREHADNSTRPSPPTSGSGSKSKTGSGSSGTSSDKKRSGDRRNSNGSRSSTGSRHSSSSETRRTGTPTSPPDTRGPPPVESTNILALLDPDLQRESFTDIESPPSPDAHVPQF